MTDAHGVIAGLLFLFFVIQFIELLAFEHGDRSQAMNTGIVYVVLIGALAIANLVCWMNPDVALVGLDKREIAIIRECRAEQTVIKAQQELQKLKQKGDTDGNDQNRDGQRRLPR